MKLKQLLTAMVRLTILWLTPMVILLPVEEINMTLSIRIAIMMGVVMPMKHTMMLMLMAVMEGLLELENHN